MNSHYNSSTKHQSMTPKTHGLSVAEWTALGAQSPLFLGAALALGAAKNYRSNSPGLSILLASMSAGALLLALPLAPITAALGASYGIYDNHLQPNQTFQNLALTLSRQTLFKHHSTQQDPMSNPILSHAETLRIV